MHLDTLYLDNHLLVINKQPGLLSQADHTGDADVVTLGKAYLKARFNKPGNVYLGLVHRLDRPASGIMVLARTSKAARRLTDQFRQRLPIKRYFAVVEGHLQGAGTCVDYLVKEDQQVRVVAPDYPKAKRAALRYQSIACARGLSLVSVELETGRAHQIRVQLAGRGYPLLGDMRYGATRELDGRNLALHCYRLGIEHPTRREPMTWEALPPPNWGAHFETEIQQWLRL